MCPIPDWKVFVLTYEQLSISLDPWSNKTCASAIFQREGVVVESDLLFVAPGARCRILLRQRVGILYRKKVAHFTCVRALLPYPSLSLLTKKA